MGWEIDASSLLTTLQQTSARLPNTPLYITENGGAFPDQIIDGKVLDFDRVDYFYAHIKTALEAAAQGIDLRGYFAWSLLDNIEWAEGISKKFGIIHNDFSNQKRTPKLSAEFLRELNLGRKR
jgi:beta-glucosidase